MAFQYFISLNKKTYLQDMIYQVTTTGVCLRIALTNSRKEALLYPDYKGIEVRAKQIEEILGLEVIINRCR